ncbi:MAG: cell division FtsZ family protein [Verrucomicrobiae bacterium]|nr:cell division FtsZ family protein [Verrucomicrobiae bacterium]
MNEIKEQGVVEKCENNKGINFRVIGVGRAGCKAVSRMFERGMNAVRLIAMDTDAPSLEQCNAHERLLLGINATRGMGSGGDPERGRISALECIEQIRNLCANGNVVFIIAGLGCGTGTGATPIVAQIAKECGALTLCIVTMPFDFEGGRARRQAFMGLRALHSFADGVICFPNDSFSKVTPQRVTIHENLKIANDYLAEGISDLWRLLTHPGEMNTTFADLCSMLQGKHAKSSIVSLEISGENRAEKFCDSFLKHPLSDNGKILSEAQSVLINFTSNGDLTTEEVKVIMDFVKKYAKKAFFKVGESLDKTMDGKLKITILSAAEANIELSAFSGAAITTTTVPKENFADYLKGQLISNESEPQGQLQDPSIIPPAPTLTKDEIEEIYRGKHKGLTSKITKLKQGSFNFEVVSHNRFEKTSPTIHKGQNLDIPTYIRRSLKLN